MRERPALFLGLLADQPELVAEVGVLRWRAYGANGTAGPWIDAAARDAGRDELPLTLVAMDLHGRAIGAATLAHDVGVHAEPSVVGLVVRPGERLCGIGRLMVAALEDLARQHGHARLHVTVTTADAEFFRHCGWGAASDEEPALLRKSLIAV